MRKKTSAVAGIVTATLTTVALLASGRHAPAQTLETWPDPAANHVVPYQTSGLTHGPMLGRPTGT